MIYAIGPYQQKKVAPLSSEYYPALPDGAVGSINLSSLAHPDVAFFCALDGVVLDSAYRELGRGDLRDITPRESERAIFASLIGTRVDGDKLIDWLYTPLTINADPAGENAPKPLMPTVSRGLDIVLNGHGLLRRQKFALDRPEAANVIELLKREYAETRRETLDGKRGRGAPDPEYHRKWLDYQGEKLRLDKPEDVLIRAGLPKESRVKHETTITDDFTRADADPLSNAAGGWSWAQVVNSIKLASNAARVAVGGYVNCFARAESDVSSADHYAQVTLGINAGSTVVVHGVCARYASGANTKYSGYWNGFEGKLYLDAVGDVAASPVFDDVLKVECNGSTISLYLNAVLKLSGTDTSVTGTRGGLYELAEAINGVGLDNFEVTDLPPATGHPTQRRFGGIEHGRMGMKGVY